MFANELVDPGDFSPCQSCEIHAKTIPTMMIMVMIMTLTAKTDVLHTVLSQMRTSDTIIVDTTKETIRRVTACGELRVTCPLLT